MARRTRVAADGPGGLIFAPWRMRYVQGLSPEGGTARCPFCPMVRARDAARLHVLHRGRRAFVVLNLYPYTPGHLLVVPNRHVGDVRRLTPAEQAECFALAVRGVAALDAVYHPAGFNVGMNLGRMGGAAVVDHVHLHVVPRYAGDSNFMPVVGGTRVCPEDLDTTYARLLPRFRAKR